MTTALSSTPGSTPATTEERLERYRAVRAFTERMCEGMEAEDFVIQSSPNVSPTKWHLAHTTWFFETFVLQRFAPDYRPLNAEYNYLFNSYYNSVGEQFCRPRRGQISRPTVREVFEYRRYVDDHVQALIDRAAPSDLQVLLETITLGTHHEQQHQELMATDIKHVFSINPLRPAWRAPRDVFASGSTENGEGEASGGAGTNGASAAQCVPPLEWIAQEGGLAQIGYDGPDFHFDNESKRHQVFLEPFELASRLVTNAEYLAFMEDGGYDRPELWLSMGWSTVREHQGAENEWERFDKPLYWFQEGGEWWQFTLSGPRRVRPEEPVVHVSYYEADAYARWADARLPTEAEWEVAAQGAQIDPDSFSDGFTFHPHPLAPGAARGRLHQMFGDAWEWTSSAYSAYPGFKPWAGAAGEYNGKFMANQLVLRGGSCATASDHIRASYRNFFHAGDRWQFMGIRLARDVEQTGGAE